MLIHEPIVKCAYCGIPDGEVTPGYADCPVRSALSTNARYPHLFKIRGFKEKYIPTYMDAEPDEENLANAAILQEVIDQAKRDDA